MAYVKSLNDGKWYPDVTRWNYVHDALCDALAYFSEFDTSDELYIIIDHVADRVQSRIEQIKNELKNEC